MRIQLSSVVMFFTILVCAAVAQEIPARTNACTTVNVIKQPVFVTSDKAMELYLDESKADRTAGDTGAFVSALMTRTGLKAAWVRAQVLVDERGEVQGVQDIDGTPEVLSAAVREVRRYRFKPYNDGNGAKPFVTVLNLKYRDGRSECNLTNPKGCS